MLGSAETRFCAGGAGGGAQGAGVFTLCFFSLRRREPFNVQWPDEPLRGIRPTTLHRRPTRHSALNSKYGISRRVSKAKSVGVKLLPLAVLPVPGV